MSGDVRSKTNLGLNLGTLVALLISIIVGGFIVGDVYDITKRVEQQSITNGIQTNQSLAFQQERAEFKNKVDNATFVRFNQLLTGLQILYNSTADAQRTQSEAIENNSQMLKKDTENQQILIANHKVITDNQKIVIGLLRNLTR